MYRCAHTEHCCRMHGCKYGDDYCPVWLGYKAQSFACEDCDYEVNGGEFNRLTYRVVNLSDIPKVNYTVFLERRNEHL